ncbi:hypothetical protein KCP71_01730 [Salmonella enterica subsp. enterica]|nr:hypothetical protein KCP71_01730 [Salmonella enterica subsp. enterica]
MGNTNILIAAPGAANVGVNGNQPGIPHRRAWLARWCVCDDISPKNRMALDVNAMVG